MKFVLTVAVPMTVLGLFTTTAQAQVQIASSPTSAAESKVPTQQMLFTQRCPARVHTLLAAAIPGSKTTDDAVKSICECAQTQLGSAGDLSADQAVPKAVSIAALRCAKPTITTYNQGVVATQFGPYLGQQGWKEAEVSQFASCFSDQHWKDTFEAGLQNHRAKGADLNTLWKQCTTVVGHADTPLPKTP
jgi:hypothetical protein